MSVAIVGAGVAGLSCAVRLQRRGVQSVLFDKGRGIGGRVATRRVGGMQFDHGARYVTAEGPEFAAVLAGLAKDSALAHWKRDSVGSVMVGTPGMSALAKAMAAGLDIRQNAQVTAIRRDGKHWILETGETGHRASQVVVTAPAPQAAALLGPDHPLIDRLQQVRYAPCLTLMAATTKPGPFVSYDNPDDHLAWIAQDNSKPGRPQGDKTWVAQAGQAFTERHLEADASDMVAEMLPLLCDRLGIGTEAVTFAATHRWRYAHVTKALDQPFLADKQLYLGGDWCLGPRIEAAWASGAAIADEILNQTARA